MWSKLLRDTGEIVPCSAVYNAFLTGTQKNIIMMNWHEVIKPKSCFLLHITKSQFDIKIQMTTDACPIHLTLCSDVAFATQVEFWLACVNTAPITGLCHCTDFMNSVYNPIYN